MIIEKLIEVQSKHLYGNIGYRILDKDSYKEIKSKEEAEIWGEHHYKDWSELYKHIKNNYSHIKNNSLIKAPLECYCGYTYNDINKYLRSDSHEEYNTPREMANILSIILCSAPNIPENIILYRLVCDEFIKGLIENNKKTPPTPFLEKGFMSTSLLKDIVFLDENYSKEKNLLKLYVKKGTIGAYVNAISRRREEEILLVPNMYVAMTKYPYKDKELDKIVYECIIESF